MLTDWLLNAASNYGSFHRSIEFRRAHQTGNFTKTKELIGVCVCYVCLFIFNILGALKCANDDFLGN